MSAIYHCLCVSPCLSPLILFIQFTVFVFCFFLHNNCVKIIQCTTSRAKSRPFVRTFVPNWKTYKLRTHSCWSLLKSTKAQPTGVRVNSTTCSVDINLTMTTAVFPSTSTQQQKRVCLTRPLPLTKCSKPMANLLSLKQKSYSRLRHRIHLRPNKSVRHRHKSSRGTTRHARKRYACLPQEIVRTLLTGDSNLRKVDRRKLDRSWGTHVRTFPGATISGMTASLSKRSPRDDVRTVVMHVGGNDMKADVAATTMKAQYKECILQVKRAFPQARVLFTGILLRKKIPTDVVRGCNACLCKLCVEENIGFIPLFSDLQKAGGKTVRAKYFDGDGVHLNERGVANMLRSIVARIRQLATRVKDSLPQDRKAHPITVQLSRRSLW